MSCSASPKNRQSRVQRQSINRHRRAQDKNLNTRLLQGKTHYKSTYEGEQEQPIETKKYLKEQESERFNSCYRPLKSIVPDNLSGSFRTDG